MKMRDDIDPTRTWVISDTHFGHRNIIDFSHRPLDHEQIIMENWARAVGPDDTLLHLGDLCFRGNAEFRALVAPHLTGGRKLLIKGNHDKSRDSFYKKCGFWLTKPFGITWGDRRVSFSHYPWNEADEGPMQDFDLRLHGHIHNSGYTRTAFVPFLKNHINLSCEQTKLAPVNLGLLLSAVIDGRYPAEGSFLPRTDDTEKESHHV